MDGKRRPNWYTGVFTAAQKEVLAQAKTDTSRHNTGRFECAGPRRQITEDTTAQSLMKLHQAPALRKKMAYR